MQKKKTLCRHLRMAQWWKFCPLLDNVGCQITSESVKSMFFKSLQGQKGP